MQATEAVSSDPDSAVTSFTVLARATPFTGEVILTVTSGSNSPQSASVRVRITVAQGSPLRPSAGLNQTVITTSEVTGSLTTSTVGGTTLFNLVGAPGSPVHLTLDAGLTSPVDGVIFRGSRLDLAGMSQSVITTLTGRATNINLSADQNGSFDFVLQPFTAAGKPGIPARARVNVSRGAPPALTVVTKADGTTVSAFSANSATISTNGVPPAMSFTLSSDAATYQVGQVVGSEVSDLLSALGVDPSSPILGDTGSTSPRLASFSRFGAPILASGSFSGGTATLDFSLRPAGALLDSEAVGGAYTFLISVKSADGSELNRLVNVPVTDLRTGRAALLLNLAGKDGLAGGSESEDGIVYTASTQLSASGTLTLDATATIDRATDARVSDGNGVPLPDFRGFIRWSQVSGPTDFGSVLEAANNSNPVAVDGVTSTRGAFLVALPGAAAGTYVFKTVADNGKSHTAALFGLTASLPGAAAAGGSSSSFGCALGARNARSGAGGSGVDLLTLLLPMGLVLGIRTGRPHRGLCPESRA